MKANEDAGRFITWRIFEQITDHSLLLNIILWMRSKAPFTLRGFYSADVLVQGLPIRPAAGQWCRTTSAGAILLFV